MRYWLIKSEPSELSIDDLAALPNQTVEWFGVRNYQARNFMRDEMQDGDLAIFWHSSCNNPGIYGIVKILGEAHPDSYQFNPQSKYYDSASTTNSPRWWCVDVALVHKTNYVSIDKLRSCPELSQMQVLKRGNRLSVSKVSRPEWEFIQGLLS